MRRLRCTYGIHRYKGLSRLGTLIQLRILVNQADHLLFDERCVKDRRLLAGIRRHFGSIREALEAAGCVAASGKGAAMQTGERASTRALSLLLLALVLWALPAWAVITDPVLWLKFDETTGTTATDAGSATENGTLHNFSGTPWAAGKVNNGLTFAGDDDYVDFGVDTTLSPGAGSFTIGIWVKPTAIDSTDHRIYNDYDEASTALVLLRLNNDNTFNCFFRDGSSNSVQASTTTTLVGGTWYHLICMYDVTAHSATIWLDTVQEGTNTNGSVGTIAVEDGTGKPLVIGGASNAPTNNPFAGMVDELRVFNHTLDSTDRTDLYNYGLVVPTRRIILR